MPVQNAWMRAVPSDIGDRARAAWAREEWAVVGEELVGRAVRERRAYVLAPLVARDVLIVGEPSLAPHVATIETLPADPVRDAALAFLYLRESADERGLAATRSAVSALYRGEPALAAGLATGAAVILVDRGRWAEAASFVGSARSAIDELRGSDAPAAFVEELWFRMMAVAVPVEWNTYGGSDLFDELSEALAAPRSRNLLRAHHGPALVAVGEVLAARGEFGAGAVSIARGAALLPDGSLIRASAFARLTHVKFRQGDWHGARRSAALVSTAEDPPSPWTLSLIRAVDTLEPAVGGDFDAARGAVARADAALTVQPSVQAQRILLHARIALVIGANDWTGMLQLLEDAEEPGYRRIYTDHEWQCLWAMALRNSGRITRYRALLAAWSREPGASRHPYHWAHVALLAQIDGDAAAALAAGRRARELVGDRDDPLGRTWTRIVVGTIISLYGDPTEGMESYEAARAELVEMDADGFVRLCTRIIEGTAAQLARASGDALTALTAQQRRVAELVAEGYTSAEIGQILYLSKKTIDFHVANILSRLGLQSRRELKRRMSNAG